MGKWIIHEVSANGKNVKAKFLSNTITINRNYSCSLPVMKQEERHSDKEQGEWSLVESMSETSLTIRSSNSFFNETYTVTLFDSAGHKGRFSKMGLRNLSTVIYCSRMSEERQGR